MWVDGNSLTSLLVSLTCFVNFIRDASLQKKKEIIVTFSFCLKYLSKLRVFNIIQEIIVHILCNFIGVLFTSFTVRDLCLIILRVLDEDYKLHTSSFDMYLNQQDEQNSCD